MSIFVKAAIPGNPSYLTFFLCILKPEIRGCLVVLGKCHLDGIMLISGNFLHVLKPEVCGYLNVLGKCHLDDIVHM